MILQKHNFLVRIMLAASVSVLFVAQPSFAQTANEEASTGNIEEQAVALMDAGKEAEAFALISSGVEAGEPLAINYLAWFYDNGRYVEKDLPRAAKLYRQAADMGVRYAKWRLGVMIDEGDAEGTVDEAFGLFREAADLGSSNAWASLAVMYASGRGTEQNYEESRKSYEMSARAGNPHAFQGLGIIHYNGEGVPADKIEGIAFWVVAMAMGNDTANGYFEQISGGISDAEMQRIIARADAISQEYGVGINVRAGVDNNANK